MTLPNFLMIGAPRAGFSTVSRLLTMHPDVCMASEVQPNFFSIDSVFAKGMKWYEGLFSHWKGQPAVGEASSSYCRTVAMPNTAPRIARTLPEARIVYLVRHPMERLESGYLRFIEELPAGVEKPAIAPLVNKIRHIIGSSLYYSHFLNYQKHFSQERMLVVFYEELRSKPAEEFGRLLKFIGVPRERAMEVDESRISEELNADRALEEEQRNRHLIQWNEIARETVVKMLQESADKLLPACGKPKDFWKIGG